MPAVVAAAAVYFAAGSGTFAAIAASAGVVGTALAGAVVGAVAGGATAALMGKDIKDGALQGALAGAGGGGIMGMTQGATALGDMGGEPEAPGDSIIGSSATQAPTTPTAGQSFLESQTKATAPTTITSPNAQAGIIQGSAPQPQDGISDIDKLIKANTEASASATKWSAMGNAASKGLEGFLDDDGSEDELNQINLQYDRQKDLEASRRISLSKDFGQGLAAPQRFATTPFADRMERLKKRYMETSNAGA